MAINGRATGWFGRGRWLASLERSGHDTSVTILERLTQSMQLTETRAVEHLKSGFVRVDQTIVYDPATEVTDTVKVTLQPPPVTEEV